MNDQQLDQEPKITCFVIGPIGDRDASLDSCERKIYEESIEVWEAVIKPSCERFGIQPLRSDLIARTGEIPEQIFKHLRDDHLVIADLTGANPNVMYELGLRHTTGKLTIQIGERGRLPFDVNTIRTIMFLRTEAGLISARKKLTQAISVGLQDGGDPVAAARVWFGSDLAPGVIGDEEGDISSTESDEPGFLEKLTDMTEGLGSVAQTAEVIAAVINSVAAMTGEASGQVDRVNTSGGSPGAKLVIANKFAGRLEEPASKLEVLSGEYAQSIERIHPGMIYILRRFREEPELQEQSPDFLAQISSMIVAVDGATPNIVSFRASLHQAGEASRELRKVSRRISASLGKIIDANERMREWRDLI